MNQGYKVETSKEKLATSSYTPPAASKPSLSMPEMKAPDLGRKLQAMKKLVQVHLGDESQGKK